MEFRLKKGDNSKNMQTTNTESFWYNASTYISIIYIIEQVQDKVSRKNNAPS